MISPIRDSSVGGSFLVDATRGRAWRVAGIAAAVVALSYLLFVLVPRQATPEDFRYIWVAGKTWSLGLDPYGPDFRRVGDQYLVDQGPIADWLYPPHWVLFAVPFGTQPFDGAIAAWKGLALLLFALTLHWTWRQLLKLAPPGSAHLQPWWFAFALSATATGGALRSGQPTFLSFLGVCLIIGGLIRGLTWVQAIGIVLALLKPQIGLPLFCVLVMRRAGWAPAAVGVLVIGLLSAVAIAAGGPRSSLVGLATLVSTISKQQASVAYNQPASMTGISNLSDLLIEHSPSMIMSAVLASLFVAVVYALAIRKKVLREEQRQELICILALCALLFFVQLHIYDLLPMLLLLPLLCNLTGWSLVLGMVGFGLLWRPENLGTLLGGTYSQSTAEVATLGIFLVCSAFSFRIVAILQGRGEEDHDVPKQQPISAVSS